jgi:hypothetical protein
MAKRKTPPRNSKGRFMKKRNAPKKGRKRRKSPKKGRSRRRTSGKGTTVVVRTNPPKPRRKSGKSRRRRNPVAPPWAMAAMAAAGVAAGVTLVQVYAPIKMLKTNMAQALLGPGVALIGGMWLIRRAKTRPMGYGLIGAGIWNLTTYATAFAVAKVKGLAEAPTVAPQTENPYHRAPVSRLRRRNGVPADQVPRLRRGVTSIPMPMQQQEYSM